MGDAGTSAVVRACVLRPCRATQRRNSCTIHVCIAHSRTATGAQGTNLGSQTLNRRSHDRQPELPQKLPRNRTGQAQKVKTSADPCMRLSPPPRTYYSPVWESCSVGQHMTKKTTSQPEQERRHGEFPRRSKHIANWTRPGKR